MPSQIMGLQTNPHQFACLLNCHSRRRIGNSKDPFVWFDPLLPDIFAQAMAKLYRDESNLCLATTFRCLNGNFCTLYVRWPQFEDLSDSHPTTSHQFHDEAVSLVLGPKDDLIHGFFFKDFPGYRFVAFEDFSEYWGIAGIPELLISRVYDEGEEGLNKGETQSFGGLPGSFGEMTQEGEDLLRSDGFPLSVTELGRKSRKNVFIVPERVFFSSSPCGNPENT